MAARQKYPNVHEQLRDLAIEARRDGVDFDTFWARAVRPGVKPVTWATPEEERPYGCVIWPRDTENRNLSRRITDSVEVREGWRRAYDRAPQTKGDLALIKLFKRDQEPLAA